jgi:stage II sporulation protein D
MACLIQPRSMVRLKRLSLLLALVLSQATTARAAQPGAPAVQPAEPLIRVLVLQAASARLRPAAVAAGVQLRDGGGRLLQELPGQVVLEASAVDGWLQLHRADDPDGEQWQVRELWLEAVASTEESDPGLWLGPRRYRGRLQLRPQGGAVQVVNHLPIETYLPSVVGSEMPASWPLEALRAQAVAARTYALKARKPAALFDVQATTASQVYKGVESETETTRAAVEGTRGLVLTYNNALIEAVFHSSSGGSTESSGHLWSKQLPYLVSVPDFDDASPVRDWRQPLAQSRLRQAFPELGGAIGIEVTATTPTGRVSQARVLGPTGQLALTGAQLRSRLGLKSTWVRFELAPTIGAPTDPSPAAPSVAAADAELEPAPVQVAFSGLAPLPPLQAFTLPKPIATPAEVVQLVAVGRGFGPGIGMSQWGAMAMAQRGATFPTILSHYYRGTALRPFAELARTARAERGLNTEAPQVLAVSR